MFRTDRRGPEILFRITAGRPIVTSNICNGFPQSLQTDTGVLPLP